jgi:hypothetical protein
MAHELEQRRKLARHRGGFLEGPTGLGPARARGAWQASCTTSPMTGCR